MFTHQVRPWTLWAQPVGVDYSLESNRLTFAIIGGGLSATAMLCQLNEKAGMQSGRKQLDPSRVTIHVYEKHEVFGPGFPYRDKFALPFHITNMCASDMGIMAGQPGDFEDWVFHHQEYLHNRFDWFREMPTATKIGPDGCRHFPRPIMGEYLKARFKGAVRAVRAKGFVVRLFKRSEVVGLKKEKGKLCLIIKDLGNGTSFIHKADRVLLATGHWQEKKDRGNYYASPWPAQKLLDNIPEGAAVAVIGTSLSAIETVLTLTSGGKFSNFDANQVAYVPPENSRKVCLYSRRGLLPKVRGKTGRRPNKYFTKKNLYQILSHSRGRVSLKLLFALLNAEMTDAYGRSIDWQEIVSPGGDPIGLLQQYIDDATHGDGPDGVLIWQTVLYRSLDLVKEIYFELPDDEKRRFDAHYSSLFFTFAAPQPAVNAKKLVALMKAGIVSVQKLGHNYQIVKDGTSGRYAINYRNAQGNPTQDRYRYVVDATGQKSSIWTNRTALVKNLLQSGTVLAGRFESRSPMSLANENCVGCGGAVGPFRAAESIWIEPATHQTMQLGPESSISPSNSIYAVGAITRGQIINASMAQGIVEATAKIAEHLVSSLIRS
jgi:uncharacterized NAD(P)/FAD-binding protein YdhS